MPKYIDAHCHINLTDVGANEIQCENDNPVNHFIINAAREEDWATLIALTARHKCITSCIGIHPWFVADAKPGWDYRLQDLLISHPEIMVGEIGLDAARQDLDLQYDVFMRQFEIAADLSRPVHIHCVRAWDKMLHVFKSTKLPPAIVAHGFNGTPELISQLMRGANVYFSYSKKILNTDNSKLRECVMCTPMDKILVESDGAPEQSQNEIPRIVAEIAKIKSVDETVLAGALYNNSIRMIKHG